MAKKVTAKSTKAEILEVLEELEQEKAALESQVAKLAKEKEKAASAPPPQAKHAPEPKTTTAQEKPAMPINQAQHKMNQTIVSLSQLQIGFGGAVSDLSEQLITEASFLKDIQEKITEQLTQLQELHDLEVAENTLDSLIDSYEVSAKAFAEELSQRREEIEQHIQEANKAWQKEQHNHQREIKERDETYQKNRYRDEKAYRYDLELRRQLDVEEYDQNKERLYKELLETREQQEKQWQEREKGIADREKQYAEAKAKVEAFPQELEQNIKNGKENGRNIGNYQAKVKSDLRAKELEGQKRNYELQIQSLEETIKAQDSRIQSLSKQLDMALKQVQDLAVKAIEGASNASSYQAMKEIALEQVKNQQKGK